MLVIGDSICGTAKVHLSCVVGIRTYGDGSRYEGEWGRNKYSGRGKSHSNQ